MDVVQNDGGIWPEICKPIFVGTNPDLYIRLWAAEKLRDGNGITKYYMIKLHYRPAHRTNYVTEEYVLVL